MLFGLYSSGLDMVACSYRGFRPVAHAILGCRMQTHKGSGDCFNFNREVTAPIPTCFLLRGQGVFIVVVQGQTISVYHEMKHVPTNAQS